MTDRLRELGGLVDGFFSGRVTSPELVRGLSRLQVLRRNEAAPAAAASTAPKPLGPADADWIVRGAIAQGRIGAEHGEYWEELLRENFSDAVSDLLALPAYDADADEKERKEIAREYGLDLEDVPASAEVWNRWKRVTRR